MPTPEYKEIRMPYLPIDDIQRFAIQIVVRGVIPEAVVNEVNGIIYIAVPTTVSDRTIDLMIDTIVSRHDSLHYRFHSIQKMRND